MQDAVIDSINGSVQSQGIKVNIENWLVIGCKEYDETPDEVKAYAYQAAHLTGWTDMSLTNAVSRKYPHLDADMLQFVFDNLKELSEKHKLEVKGEVAVPSVSFVRQNG